LGGVSFWAIVSPVSGENKMTWDWQVFLTDDGSGRTYLEWMLEAWRWTLAVAASSWVVAMLVGAVVGTLRTLPGRPVVAALANAWVELFRNIPLLVQIFLWYFVVPKIFPAFQQVPGFLLVVFGLGFLPRHVSPSNFARASRPCPKASVMRPWPWGSPPRSLTVT
jgi:His/Glu/Gln/Arg/opine family amino acid ABC transporter permease subunit